MIRIHIHSDSELANWHLEHLVTEVTFVGLMLKEMTANNLPPPAHLTEYHRSLTQATENRVIANMKVELENAKSRRAAYASRKEKADASEAQIRELEEKLGLRPKTEEAKK